MSAGTVPKTEPRASLDAALRRLRERLEARGLDVAQLVLASTGELRVRLLRPALVATIEPASERSPVGRVVAMGALRAVVTGERGETSSSGLAALLRVLDAERRGSLGRWLEPARVGGVEVPRSVEGLQALLAPRMAPGETIWDHWGFDAIETDEEGALRLRFRGVGASECCYALVALPRAGERPLIQTGLGQLVRRPGGVAPSDGASLDPVVALLVSRAVGEGARWVEPEQPAISAPPQDDGAARETRARLLDLCLGGGLQDERSRQPLLSDFFEARGHQDAYGQTVYAEQIRAGAGVFHVGHDCHMATASLDSRWESGFRRWKGRIPNMEDLPSRVHVTGMDDLVVAMGGEARLEEVLEGVLIRQPGEKVRVFTSCDFHMIGDNVPGVCRKCEAGRVGLIDDEPPHVSAFNGVDTAGPWERFLDRCEPSPPPREDAWPSVNLVGYEGFGHEDVTSLIRLLASAGVAVEAVLLPGLSPDAEQVFRRARLTLLSPGEPVPMVFGRALAARGFPFSAPALPFGVAGTLRWLDEVLAALGLPSLDAESRRALREKGEARVGPYRARAQGLRVGVLFDAGTLQELLSPTFFHGVDLRELFDDTDCRLEIVSVPRWPANEEHDPALVADLAARGVAFRAHPAGCDPEDVLREGRYDMVYCEVDSGRLVKRHGALPLDIRDLRMGLDGAAHNARWLSHAAVFPLYRRFRALGAAAENRA